MTRSSSHLFCPWCGSRRASYYDHQDAAFDYFCHKCRRSWDEDDSPMIHHAHNEPVAQPLLDPACLADWPQSFWGITSQAASELGLCLLLDDDGRPAGYVAEYRNPDTRELEWQKVKYRNGRRSIHGKSGKYLFGQHRFRQKGRTLYVTEGEKDAAAVRTAFDTWPVVSVPSGAQSAHSVIAEQLQYVLQFQEIVLAFDSDVEGQKAAKRVAELLPPGRVRVVADYGEDCKDAHECLVKHGLKALRTSLWNAPVYSPISIIGGGELWQAMFADVPRGHDWFLPGLSAMCSGRRPHQIQLIGGPTGAGKTSVAMKQAAWDIQNGLTVGLLTLEEGPEDAGRRILQEMTGRPFFLEDHSMDIEAARPYADLYEKLIGPNLWCVEHSGSVKASEMDAAITWLAAVKKCDVIYVDHLTLAVSDDSSSNSKVDALMARLISLVQQHPFHLTALCQLRKGGKSWEFGAPMSQQDFRGSSSIMDAAFYAWGVERDQTTDQPGKIRVVKRRKGKGPIGVTDGYMIDPSTGCVHACAIPAWEYSWESKERNW